MKNHKKCLHCGKYFSKDKFHKNKMSSDGLRPECKTCRKLYHQKYRQTDAFKISQLKNKERQREYCLNYRRNVRKCKPMHNRVGKYYLSTMQEKVLKELHSELDLDKIAQKLERSSWTIKCHVNNLCSRLNVNYIQELQNIAREIWS